MKEFIDKLISELKEEHERCINRYGIVGGNVPAAIVKNCMNIVNQLAEEYINCSTEYINCSTKVSEMPTGSEDYCEWVLIDYEANVYDTTCRNPHILLEGSPIDNNYEFCPYCGKKIKVVE